MELTLILYDWTWLLVLDNLTRGMIVLTALAHATAERRSIYLAYILIDKAEKCFGVQLMDRVEHGEVMESVSAESLYCSSSSAGYLSGLQHDTDAAFAPPEQGPTW